MWCWCSHCCNLSQSLLLAAGAGEPPVEGYPPQRFSEDPEASGVFVRGLECTTPPRPDKEQLPPDQSLTGRGLTSATLPWSEEGASLTTEEFPGPLGGPGVKEEEYVH